MKPLWITDPWDRLDHPRDTTLRWAEESLSLGHESWWANVRSVAFTARGRVVVRARRILEIAPGRAKDGFRLGSERELTPESFDAVHYRTDPPVDLAYLQPLQLLALSGARVVNPASLLLTANEKTEAFHLGKLMPPTAVSSDAETLARFGGKEGRAVLKPLHEAASRGVELLTFKNDAEGSLARTMARIREATQGGTRLVLLQRYLPGISDGETRLWFLDGRLLAHVRKLPLASDFRVNIDRGSGLAVARLSAREKSAALTIGRHLRSRNIRLAAVDLIEGLVTDFNFTSPGLIVQMENLLNENLSRKIIQALARRP